MFVAPLCHWYLADGCLVEHVNACGVSDITLIVEFDVGVESNDTESIGTETMIVRLVNKLLISNMSTMLDYYFTHSDLVMLCGHYVCIEMIQFSNDCLIIFLII